MNIIQVTNLRKNYKNKEIVKDISFDVKQGEIFGMLGPNGAGKTTTMEMIEGLRRRDGGHISVLGLDPGKRSRQLYQRIGIQFQSTSLQRYIKLKEALQLFSSFYRVQDLSSLIERLELQPYLNTYFKDLSGGCKQRLMIALATLHDPEIIFLDEPSTGLDPKARHDLRQLIRQLKAAGKTILIATHDMEEARQLCDRVAFFYQGNILAIDTPYQLALKYSSKRFIHFASAEAQLADLQQLPSVERIEQDGDLFKIYSNSLEAVSLELFQLIDQQNWSVQNFAFIANSLEDLFIHIAEGGTFVDEYTKVG